MFQYPFKHLDKAYCKNSFVKNSFLGFCLFSEYASGILSLNTQNWVITKSLCVYDILYRENRANQM